MDTVKWLQTEIGGGYHLCIAPRHGRGNKSDGWKPMCGNDKEVAPWLVPERELEDGKAGKFCTMCLKLKAEISATW